jgi:hypothetical protein
MQSEQQPVTPAPVTSAAPPGGKPGSVQTIAIVTLVSGILNCILGVSLIIATFFIWTLPAVYSIVVGIMEIVYASKLMADPVKVTRPAKHIAIMEIVNVVNGSVTSLAAGIVALVLYNSDDVRAFFARLGGGPGLA